jgi:hypothetical protein
VAARLGLAPRSFRLTGERITLILPSKIKWSGIPVSRRVISSSQARRISFFLMPDGGGLSPQTFSGSLCFQDRYGAVVRFTIHKVVIPARIALAASSFAGKRSCSAELRDNKLVEVEGIAPTRSILQGLAVPMTVTPNCYRQELHPHLRR